MYPLVPIVYHPLLLSGPANWTHCAINKSETVIQWSTFPKNRVTVHLKRSRVKQLWIPSGDAMQMGIENKVNNTVTNHTEDRNWPSKAGNQVAVATRIRHSPHDQYHAQTLHSVTYCSLGTGKLFRNPQGVGKKWEVCLEIEILLCIPFRPFRLEKIYRNLHKGNRDSLTGKLAKALGIYRHLFRRPYSCQGVQFASREK